MGPCVGFPWCLQNRLVKQVMVKQTIQGAQFTRETTVRVQTAKLHSRLRRARDQIAEKVFGHQTDTKILTVKVCFSAGRS